MCELNARLDPLPLMTEVECQSLISAGRVASTQIRTGFALGVGHIITQKPMDLEEAKRIALQRGFGELVQGFIQ